jgi:hypothetical protein
MRSPFRLAGNGSSAGKALERHCHCKKKHRLSVRSVQWRFATGERTEGVADGFWNTTS